MAERISGNTELVGLFAYPIKHSKSPRLHNEAFAKLGIDIAYLAFEVDETEIKKAIDALRVLKLRGANISMPNKIEVIQYLDELSPAAEMAGAVNTVVNTDGYLVGHNTDGIGFVSALKDNGIDIIGKKMTIVGAGGAATAIQVQASLDGIKNISVFNNKDAFWSRAENNAKNIMLKTECDVVLYDLDNLDKLKEEIATSDIFVNATGVGMKPLEGQTYIPSLDFFHPDLVVFDVVYSPKETALLKMSREAGCKSMNGEGMLLFQASAACQLWTGQAMPIEYMKEVLGITY